MNSLNEELLAPHTPGALTEGQRWLAAIDQGTAIGCTAEQSDRMRSLMGPLPSCLKDPRFCYTLQHWLAALPAAEAEASLCLCVFRDPRTVVSSTLQELAQAPYLQSLQRSADQILDAWQQHYRWVLQQQDERGRWLFIHYDDLFTPVGLDRLETFSGCAISRSLPRPSLRRSAPHPIELPPACQELYATLQARARN